MNKSRAITTSAVITTSAYLGFVLLIGISYCVYWTSMEPLAFMRDFKEKFPLFVPGAVATMIPATVLTLLLAINRKEAPEARRAWIVAASVLLAVNAITMVYHIPVNLGFMKESYKASEVAGKLQLWVILHWVRVVLALVASVYAVIAFEKEVLHTRG
ncbi:MAG: DUF1772 domain-containing protein [Deltaproteobacteria bacterium]|nr:MAG: DUF1772 domain-containing protein [Deltaproteobacteria bacterium]